MRRVSIAIELLDDPALLLLDEPTSGLDSNLAFDLMNTLWQIAKAGRTVIVTIHQPISQVFSMLDNLLLLDQGRVVYQGLTENAKQHFSSLGHECPAEFSPADFLMDLLSSPAAAAKRRRAERLLMDAQSLQGCDSVDLEAQEDATGDDEEHHSGGSAESSKGRARTPTDPSRESNADVDIGEELARKFHGSAAWEEQQEMIAMALADNEELDNTPIARFMFHTQPEAWRVWFLHFGTLFM
eukprot:Polyplicarium_translucidae@DN4045_c0_g1_i1.p1